MAAARELLPLPFVVRYEGSDLVITTTSEGAYDRAWQERREWLAHFPARCLVLRYEDPDHQHEAVVTTYNPGALTVGEVAQPMQAGGF